MFDTIANMIWTNTVRFYKHICDVTRYVRNNSVIDITFWNAFMDNTYVKLNMNMYMKE